MWWIVTDLVQWLVMSMAGNWFDSWGMFQSLALALIMLRGLGAIRRETAMCLTEWV